MRGFILTTVAVLVAIAFGVGVVGGLPPLTPLASNGYGYISTGGGGVGWLTIHGSGSRLTGTIVIHMNSGKCGHDGGYLFDPCAEVSHIDFVRVGNTLVISASSVYAASTWDIRPDALIELVPGATPPQVRFARVTSGQYRHTLALYEAFLAAYRWCLPKGVSISRDRPRNSGSVSYESSAPSMR